VLEKPNQILYCIEFWRSIPKEIYETTDAAKLQEFLEKTTAVLSLRKRSEKSKVEGNPTFNGKPIYETRPSLYGLLNLDFEIPKIV
jgi:hypothetical protein